MATAADHFKVGGSMQFTKATKKQARLRMALIGPAGSGKTYSALAIATAMGGKTAVIDTEHGSASKYAGIFAFDVLELDSFAPSTYVAAIQAADEAGYDNIVVDSLSHAWMGKGGALEIVDKVIKNSRSGNSYMAWGEVTPEQNKMVEALLACRAHLFATMRSKTEYILEEVEKNGRKTSVPRKVGMAPVQRDGVEYEFDVIGDLTMRNSLVISKTRCPALTGMVFDKPGPELAEILKTWLTDGEAPPQRAAGFLEGLDPALHLSEEEANGIQEWIDATATDPNAFLRHYKVRKISELSPSQYEDAIRQFERKAQRGATA